MICYTRQSRKWIFSPSSLEFPPLFPLISFSSFFWLLTQCSSQHNAAYCRSKVVCSEHRLSGCLLTFILISKGSIFPLSALLLSPSLIDISISAILPLRSGANQCRVFSFLLQLSFFSSDASLSPCLFSLVCI